MSKYWAKLHILLTAFWYHKNVDHSGLGRLRSIHSIYKSETLQYVDYKRCTKYLYNYFSTLYKNSLYLSIKNINSILLSDKLDRYATGLKYFPRGTQAFIVNAIYHYFQDLTAELCIHHHLRSKSKNILNWMNIFRLQIWEEGLDN